MKKGSIKEYVVYLLRVFDQFFKEYNQVLSQFLMQLSCSDKSDYIWNHTAEAHLISKVCYFLHWSLKADNLLRLWFLQLLTFGFLCRGIPARVNPFSGGICRNIFSFCCARSSLHKLEALPSLQELGENARPYTCTDCITCRCCWYIMCIGLGNFLEVSSKSWTGKHLREARWGGGCSLFVKTAIWREGFIERLNRLWVISLVPILG